MSTYTKADLKENSRRYEENFRQLLKAKRGSRAHVKCCRIEGRLHHREIVIRKALGILAADPCPLYHSTRPCNDCTGRYKHVLASESYTNRRIPVMAEKGEGERCGFKPGRLKG